MEVIINQFFKYPVDNVNLVKHFYFMFEEKLVFNHNLSNPLNLR
jgi:hypothetical protein